MHKIRKPASWSGQEEETMVKIESVYLVHCTEHQMLQFLPLLLLTTDSAHKKKAVPDIWELIWSDVHN